MCMYLNEITDVVNEFINDEMMFTAWDVTIAVRKRSKDRVQHYEVKKEVHQMFENSSMFSYNRTLANLPNINPQPWIYHPLAADSSIYNGKPVSLKVVVAALPAPNSISSVDDDSDIAADGTLTYKFDSTDRLCVPNKMIRQLGLKDSDPITVSQSDPSELTLGAGLPSGATHIADYHVDRYDNVRIGRATFTKAGICGVAFEMNCNGRNIKVKKYA